MINPFDYLYYKIYNALSFISGGGNPINHIGAMGILLASNLFTICILIYGGFPPNIMVFGIGFIIILIYPFFYGTKREKRIVNKYKNESKQSCIIGNIVVICYVILTFTSLILVMKHYSKA